MNWEQEVYIDRDRVKLNIEKGYKYLVSERNPKPYDVDDDADDYLYSLLVDELDVKSYFHVGFSMGRTLVSVSRLLPKIKVGGITWFDNSVAFGQQIFNLTDHRELDIQIGEYPYKPINGSWDFINLGRLPDKSNLGADILRQACEDTNKYVFFFASPGQVKVYDDAFECTEYHDSGLEFVPVLLTRKTSKPTNQVIDEMDHVSKTLFEKVVDGFTAVDNKTFEFGKGVESDPLVDEGVIEEELEKFFNREKDSDDTNG